MRRKVILYEHVACGGALLELSAIALGLVLYSHYSL